MATLRALVEEMAQIQRGMGDAALAARQDPTKRPELVEKRRRFAQQVTLINAVMDEDPQLAADPELAQLFRQRFSAMRSKIAIHQAKWPAVLLDETDPEFIRSAQEIIDNNRAFAAWAQNVLRK